MLIQGNHPINIYSDKLQVNRLARKARHRKNFSTVSSMALKLNRVVQLPKLRKFKAKALAKPVSDMQILKRAIGFVAFFVIITSFTPNIAFSDAEYSYEQISAGPLIASNIIADDSGFIIPVNPQTGEADRSEMSDKITHQIESGETLSTIAEMYGLKTKTLMWENNMGTGSILKVGNELVIPPVDGVTHTVKSGQSVEKIASLYEVESEDIIKQNGLESGTLAAGDKIFVPGGVQLAPPTPTYVASNTATRDVVRSTSSATRVELESTTAAPAAGKFLIYPTRGKITQGYYSYHRAIDIADASKPPIWAAAAGTVVKASSGTWGGGYGNHIIIDHGNGVQTLYAHLDYLTVSNGQYVTQGEVIGRMGNTGRVYGRTGIHLHFEVRDNGIKMYPGNYW